MFASVIAREGTLANSESQGSMDGLHACTIGEPSHELRVTRGSVEFWWLVQKCSPHLIFIAMGIDEKNLTTKNFGIIQTTLVYVAALE